MAIENRQKIGEDKYILVETGQLQYEINEYDSLTGVYVYATRDSQYSLDEVIAESNYSFQEITGTNYIVFDAGFPIDDFYSFKLIEPLEEATRQSSIISVSDITPESLNNEFNNIVDYLKKLQDEMNKRELRIDNDEDFVMLPKLQNNEFWLKTTTGYRATDFSALEGEIQDTFNSFFGIIGGVDPSFTWHGVTSVNGNYVLADGSLGVEADGIALQTNGSQPTGTYFVLTCGFAEIPAGATDDLGQPYVTDTYYYQSTTVAGGFSKLFPVAGINKKMFKTSLRDGVLWALFQFHPLEFGSGTVTSEFIKYFVTEALMKSDLTLGLNQRIKLEKIYYRVAAAQENPGDVLLNNGLWAVEIYDIQELQDNIGTNTNNISTNANNIGTNTTNIGTNTTNIGNNTTAINNKLDKGVGLSPDYDTAKKMEDEIKKLTAKAVLFDGLVSAKGVITLNDNWDNFEKLAFVGRAFSGVNFVHTTFYTDYIQPSDGTAEQTPGELRVYDAGANSFTLVCRDTNRNEMYCNEISGGRLEKVIGINKIN